MSSLKYRDCKDLFAVLSQYLDKELTAEDCEQIEEHIAGCEPCVKFVNSLKKSVELCRAAEAVPTPPPLSDDVRDKLLAAYRQSLKERDSAQEG